MQINSWPTAAVFMVAIAAVVVTLLAGPSLGLDTSELLTAVVAEGVGGMGLLALMRNVFAAKQPPRVETSEPTPRGES